MKVLSSAILHKTDVGGVAVVERTAQAVADAVGAMRQRLADREVDGFLIAEFVAHDPRFGGELLLGARWTEDFGPIVTLGFGGTNASLLFKRYY